MRPHKFAKKLGISVKTLHRWDESGKLKAKRTPPITDITRKMTFL